MVATPSDLGDPPRSELAIERVTGASGLAEAQVVCEAGFGAPSGRLASLYGSGLAEAPGFSIYLGRVDGKAVATSIGALAGDTVGIFAVATVPDQRGRGYGAAITEHAALTGMAQGVDLAWLQSSAMGEGVYRRIGFRAVETYSLFARAR